MALYREIHVSDVMNNETLVTLFRLNHILVAVQHMQDTQKTANETPCLTLMTYDKGSLHIL